MKTAVMTDTNSGITKQEADVLGIFLMQMPVIIDGETHYEGLDLTHDSFFAALTGNQNVSTSQPSPGDVMDMWDEILKVLEEKVKEGVEVRVMYDGMCCLMLLPFHYPRQLERKGIRCKMFSPIIPVLSTHQNYRDHRKVTVIDGHTAFTGGVNLADEYINRKERFGQS